MKTQGRALARRAQNIEERLIGEREEPIYFTIINTYEANGNTYERMRMDSGGVFKIDEGVMLYHDSEAACEIATGGNHIDVEHKPGLFVGFD